MEPPQHRVTATVTASDGVRLAVHEHPGPAGAPVILCVHGFPDDHRVWDRAAARLAAQGRFRVVTYDVRGSGGSDAPAAPVRTAWSSSPPTPPPWRTRSARTRPSTS